MFSGTRTKKELAVSIASALLLVALLAVLAGTLTRVPFTVVSGILSAVGLVGIWLFDEQERPTIKSDIADYLALVGQFGLWIGLVQESYGWLVGIPVYWVLTTLVRRQKHGT